MLVVEALVVAVVLSIVCRPEPVPTVECVVDKELHKCDQVLHKRLEGVLHTVQKISNTIPPVSEQDLDEELANLCAPAGDATTGSARVVCFDSAIQVESSVDSDGSYDDLPDFEAIQRMLDDCENASQGSFGSGVESFTPELRGFALESGHDDSFESELSTLTTSASINSMPCIPHEQSALSASSDVFAQGSYLSEHACSTVLSFDPERDL